MKDRNSVSYLKRRMTLRISQYHRKLTSRDRVLPNYIIIGVQKGGTSSLFNYLTRHPNVLAGYKKEVKFFDGNYQKGLDWYRYNFPLHSQMSNPQTQTGEASPSYVFHPLVPKRIKESLPAIKLILLLRDPVARAYSHYQGNLRKGHEKASFEEAVDKEPERLAGEREKIIADQSYPMHDFLVYSYLARGIYIDQVKTWFESFPREQMLILRSEDFFKDPRTIYRRVLNFLGLPEWELDTQNVFNVGDYQKMDRRMEQKLREHYYPYNQELSEYLGMNFHWE